MNARKVSYRIAIGFLAISYGLAAPFTAYLENREATLSERFDLPPALIYLTCAVQFVCAFAILNKRLAPWCAAALSIITLGAIGSHVRIGSPLTAVPAVVYTVVQIWVGLNARSGAAPDT